MKRVLSRMGAFAVMAAAAVTLLTPQKSHAFAFVYHFDIGGDPIFSGAPPSATAPWVDLFIADGVAPGTVSLIISNVGLSGTEKLTSLYVNLDPTKAPTSLTFTVDGSSSGVFVPTIANGEISLGVNNFKADGDGKYDILFEFGTSAANDFQAGQYIAYTVAGIPGLSALDFYNFLSLPAGGHGPFLAAGHVQGIVGPCGDSGWIAPTDGPSGVEIIVPIPEPASGALLALAGAAWFVRMARRRS